MRYDHHEFFGGHTAYRLTASARINDRGTRLKGSLNSGFNAPSLVQLFDPFYGDTDLRPEESHGWELGIEQTALDERMRLGATWFSQKTTNIFGFDPSTYVTINIDRAKSDGAELFAEFRGDRVSTRLDYTYTNARDFSDGSALLRRAKNKLSAQIAVTPERSSRLGLRLTHIGSRPDIDFEIYPAERVRLAPYNLVTLTAQRRVTNAFTVFGRIENLLDERYREVERFATPGRAAYLGLRATY